MHRRVLFCWVVLGTLCFGIESALARDFPDGFIGTGILVRTKVIGSIHSDGFRAAVLQVTHVYSGEIHKDEDVFMMRYVLGGGNPPDLLLLKAPQVGDEMICIAKRLEAGPSKSVLVVGGEITGATLFQRFPIGDSESGFKATLGWAEAVENAVRADPKARSALVHQCLHSSSPQIAAWAGSVLAQFDEPKSLEALVSDDKLSLDARIGLDAGLVEVQKDWSTSQQRADFLLKWCSGPVDEAQGRWVIGTLESVVKGRKFPQVTVRNLLHAVMNNPRIGTETKKSAIRLLRDEYEAADTAEQRAVALADLKEQATHGSDESLRQTAEYHLTIIDGKRESKKGHH